MKDRILVLGASGFIGQALVQRLAQRGMHVLAASRRQTEFAQAQVKTVIAELREPRDFVPLVAGSRAVVYVASTSTPGTSAGCPLVEVTDNLQPLAALLQVLQDHAGIDLLYLSSGGSLYTAADGFAATETTPVQPRSYHGAGKIAAEYFITAWCDQYAGNATMVRPSNVYGPGQIERTGFGIVPAALGKIQRGETLHVWGDGSVVRDYLYIDDLVSLISAMLAKPLLAGAKVVNACSGSGVSLNELFAAMEAVTGRSLLRSYELRRTLDASCVAMDATLAQQEYGFAATTTLYEGLKRTWAWLNSTTR